MKILLAQNMLYIPSLGGANKANRLLLEGLAARQHECRAVARSLGMQGSASRAQFLDELASRSISLLRSTAVADVFVYNGVEAHVAADGARLQALLIEQIQAFDPTWIIVSSDDPGQALLEAALEVCPERVIYLVHTTSYLPFGPGSFFQSQANTEMLQKVAHILVVSDFLHDYILRLSGLDSLPIPLNPLTLGAGPFPELGQPDRGYVTIINPSAVKGISIFLALARVFPAVAFAAVPTWATTDADRAALEQQPNVRLLRPGDDMDALFAQTRVLLVPSLWNEAFGRVAVEAMLRGIPVLASNTGGLPEAKLGVPYVLPVRPIEHYTGDFDDRGFPVPIIPAQELQPWQAALHEILADDDTYRRIARASRTAALDYIAQYPSIASVEALLMDLAPRRSRPLSRIDQHAAYWMRQLADAPALLELPFDHPRALARPLSYRAQPFTLAEHVRQALVALSKERGTTLFATLLAAFQVLLSRYTRQTDILINTPVAAEGQSSPRDLAGSVVIRADLAANPGFHELLSQIAATVQAAFEHQDFPLSAFLARAQGDAVTVPYSLTQVSFRLYPEGGPPMEGDQLRGVELAGVQPGSACDLLLSLWEQDAGLVGQLIYNQELFEPATIQGMAGHLATVLAAIVADPTGRILDLPLLSTAEQHLLTSWNATDTVYPGDGCLHWLIEAQVERTPDSTAVVFEQQQLTYHELNRLANQLAHQLQALGAGPETRVGICMERSPELVVALVAILKAGAAYVPLDPEYPQERLRFMLQDAQASILLTQRRLEPLVTGEAQHVLALDGFAADCSSMPTTNPTSGVTPDHAAYLIYTSGSTGRPKGVINTHRGIVNRLLWMQATYGLDGADRVLQKTPYSFDVSVWEFFWPLLSGAQLVVAAPGGHRDSGYLVRLIAEQGITTTHFVPSMLRIFLEERSLMRSTSLKRVICSGEALPLDLQERFFERVDAALHNLYGPTEAAVDVTAWACRRDQPYHSVPIGHPVANTQLYVLDQRLKPVPIGVPGELYIGGVQVARGYFNRPELTAERFVPDPFGGKPGTRLYCTGDLGRFLRTGAIEYLGRLDFQVKIRGFRIELREIETTLKQHPAVHDAVVVTFDDRRGDQQLAAYVVEENQAPDGEQGADQSTTASPSAVATGYAPAVSEGLVSTLRVFLTDRLPAYMVPSAFVQLDALPLTSNGKLDRKALPAPAQLAPEDRPGFVAPRTPVEEGLAQIWADVMRMDRIGIHDNFFDLGGHSLLATQMISRVRAAFHVEISLRNLFTAPTIAALAERITTAQAMAPAPDEPVIPRVPRDQPLRAALSQERRFLVDRTLPDVPLRQVNNAYRLTGPLDVPALAWSLAQVVRRHEALRTTFHATPAGVFQVIAPALPVPLPLVDLRGLPPAQREAAARARIVAAATQPFDRARGPLLRSTLYQLDVDTYVWDLSLDHIVCDGWSVRVLSHELAQLYQARIAGQADPLPPLPIQYADWASWQRERLQGARRDRLLAYWRQQLGSSTTTADLTLPFAPPRPPRPSYRGATETQALSVELSTALRQRAQAAQVTLYMLFLAALQGLLHRYSGAAAISVASSTANRRTVASEALIGYLSHALILRTDLTGTPTLAELLGRVRELLLGVAAHDELPYAEVVRALEPAKYTQPAVAPIVAYDLVRWGDELALPGLAVERFAAHRSTNDPGFCVWVLNHPEAFRVVLSYECNWLAPAHAQRILRDFVTLLTAFSLYPHQRLADVPLIPE